MFKKTLLAAAAFAAMTSFAAAETIEVKMLNRDEAGNRNVFEPAFIVAQPGDVIKFVSTDKGHNSYSLDGMVPEGVEEWKSRINQDFELTVGEAGVYGFGCTPHYGLGMVGLIYVPNEDGSAPANLETAMEVKHRGKAADKFEELFAQLDEAVAANTQ